MASWNHDLLNRFIAPGIAQFTEAVIPEAIEGIEKPEHWMANHFLNNVFRSQFAGKQRQFAFNIIYRAQACFDNFTDARERTLRYLAENTPSNPNSLQYFRALRTWESCFLNLQALVELLNKFTSISVFDQEDGSPEQIAYDIANTIKHWGKSISRGEHHDDDTVPMWLSNQGFHTRKLTLPYESLASVITEAATVANDLQDPQKWSATEVSL